MAENAREIFVRNLAALMERRGITQTDIIRELGVSSSTVSDWCCGKLYPRANNMQRLAELLGVGLSALTSENGLDNIDDIDRLEALHQNPRLGLLFDRAKKMSADDVEFMMQMADRILKERDGE